MSSKRYTKKIIGDYCVLDTETTGLSAYYDEVIEIGILRVRDNKIESKYSQLIQPEEEIDSFITALTGITNEMVSGMPTIGQVKEEVKSFLGDDIILGHNTSFDVRFIDAGFQEELSNHYMDTMQFSRKLYPELEHHRLSDLTTYLGLSNNEHRAIADCISTKELYDAIKAKMLKENLKIEDLWVKHSGHSRGIDISEIIPTGMEIDEDNFFFGRHVVFTGKLERMIRKDAMQLVVNLGGILDKSVTKTTNYLILGNNDYNPILRGEKSSKQKKAEKLKLQGQDIDIIDEFTFYDLLNE
jgi:DNA polymerase-3 subunit epsilon